MENVISCKITLLYMTMREKMNEAERERKLGEKREKAKCDNRS